MPRASDVLDSLAPRRWPLFPLAAWGKLPAIRAAHPEGDPTRGTCRGACGQPGHGLWDARADPATLTRWAQLYPGCNWGVAAGQAGLVVIDVDRGKGSSPARVLPDQGEHEVTPAGVLDGDDVLTWAAERDGAAAWPPATYSVTTPSGGRHYYFRPPARLSVRSSASRLGWCVDVRADGGYVVGAGSASPTGQWEADDPGADVADLPSWLLVRLAASGHCPALAPAPAAAPRRPAPLVVGVSAGRQRAYVEAALRQELGDVAGAAEGTRNVTLNRASFALGTLVDVYGLDLRPVADALLDAALAAGLSDGEARATIRSGLSEGRRHPRTAAGGDAA